MPSISLSELEIYKAILVICSAGLVVGTLEFLWIRRSFSADGVYSWTVFSAVLLKTRNVNLKKMLDAVFRMLRVLWCYSGSGLVGLLCILFTPPSSTLFKVSLAIVIISILCSSSSEEIIWRRWRRPNEHDSPDYELALHRGG